MKTIGDFSLRGKVDVMNLRYLMIVRQNELLQEILSVKERGELLLFQHF